MSTLEVIGTPKFVYTRLANVVVTVRRTRIPFALKISNYRRMASRARASNVASAGIENKSSQGVNKFVLREAQIARAPNSSFAKMRLPSVAGAQRVTVSHFLKYLLHSAAAAAISQSRSAEIMRVAIFCSYRLPESCRFADSLSNWHRTIA